MNGLELMAALGSMVMITVTIIILAVIFTRRSRAKPQDLTQLDDRLLRMEQALDSVAVEVERISEAQRFATKLLTERERAQVPAERSGFDRR